MKHSNRVGLVLLIAGILIMLLSHELLHWIGFDHGHGAFRTDLLPTFFGSLVSIVGILILMQQNLKKKNTSSAIQ